MIGLLAVFPPKWYLHTLLTLVTLGRRKISSHIENGVTWPLLILELQVRKSTGPSSGKINSCEEEWVQSPKSENWEALEAMNSKVLGHGHLSVGVARLLDLDFQRLVSDISPTRWIPLREFPASISFQPYIHPKQLENIIAPIFQKKKLRHICPHHTSLCRME